MSDFNPSSSAAEIEASSAASAPQTGGAQPSSEGWAPPSFLPESLRGKDEKETFDRVSNDWLRQRNEISRAPKPGNSVDDYAYKPSEKVAPFVGDLSRDPIYGLAREAAFKSGMPPQLFSGMVSGLYESMAEQGLLPKPYSAEDQMRAFLGDDAARGLSSQQMMEKISPIVVGLNEWINGVANQAKLDANGADALRMLLDTSDGLHALQAIQKISAVNGISGGGVGGGGGLTHASLKAMQADPRCDRNSPQYNKDFADDVEKKYQQFFGS